MTARALLSGTLYLLDETETDESIGAETTADGTSQEAENGTPDVTDPGSVSVPDAVPDAVPDPDDDSQTVEIGESSYKVELDVFEGPMDLLLYLIKKDEIDIYDIPIESITKQYMGYLETFKMLNIGLAGEFLVMAANLCYIKSRMMLPKHVQPPEEDADEEDPRWDLIRQLIEYKKFKEAANFLGKKEEEEQERFTRKPEKIESGEDEQRPLSEDLGIFDLIRAFQNILDRFEESTLGEIIDDRFTVSDRIDHLLNTVQPGGTIRFSALFEEAVTKGEMIVTFLAVLELMKLNYFCVRQEVILGDIELQRNEV